MNEQEADDLLELAWAYDELRYDVFRSPEGLYFPSPAAFATDCIDWPGDQFITDYQLEAIENVVRYGREAMRGPHGVGKTTPAALLILWFSLTRDGRDWKCPTTASVGRQLKEFLWPEVHKWAGKLRWEVIGRPPFRSGYELQDMHIRLSTGSAFPVASNNAAQIEGAHADHILYVYDEAKTIPEATWDASEGAFSGAGPDTGREAFAVAFSTPGDNSGRFYAINRRDPRYADWHVRVVTLQEAIDAGRISEAWAEARKAQWGENSAMYQRRVLGNFHSDEDAVIPLAWVEAAVERWRDLERDGMLPAVGKATAIGVDVGDEGPDSTVLAPRYDRVYMPLEEHVRGDPMQTSGHVVVMQERIGGVAVVDVIGVGSGVVARLRELKRRVAGFNASESARHLKDRSGELEFANMRAAAWWGFREKLDPELGDGIALPPDDELVADLSSPKWRMTSAGKILVEPKDGDSLEWGIRQRLGRSTNKGDAVVQASALEISGGAYEVAMATGSSRRIPTRER